MEAHVRLVNLKLANIGCHGDSVLRGVAVVQYRTLDDKSYYGKPLTSSCDSLAPVMDDLVK